MIHHKRNCFYIALLLGLGCSGMTLADSYNLTCPTDLQRDHNGRWFSHEKPGWKSHKSTHEGITVNAHNFGGVVYSPKRHRIACVYKASNGKWVALISSVHRGIQVDKYATDLSGNRPAWKYSAKHKDYACGNPAVKHINDCSFRLSN